MDQKVSDPRTIAALVKAQVDIATLESDVRHLAASLVDLKRSNEKLAEQLATITELLSEAKGGWRTLMFLGGAAATMGAFVSWLLEHVTLK